MQMAIIPIDARRKALRDSTNSRIQESKKPQQRIRVSKRETCRDKKKRINEMLKLLESDEHRRVIKLEHNILYFITTAEIISLKLTPLEEQVLSICCSFSREGKFTFLTNRQFAKLCNRNQNTISATLKALEKYGLITRDSEYDSSRRIQVPRSVLDKLGFNEMMKRFLLLKNQRRGLKNK
jgi:hypothetical protein